VPPECCAMCRIRRQTLRHRMQWLACSRRIYAVVMPRRQRGSKKFLTPARGLWVLARFGGSCGRGDPRRCSGSASTRRRTSSDLDFCTASGGFGPMPRSNSTRCRVTNKPRSSQSEMVGVHSMLGRGEVGFITAILSTRSHIRKNLTPNDISHPTSESEVPWAYARAVIEFTTAVIDTESVDEVLWLLTDDIVQDLGFEDCVIYLMDEVRSKLVQKAAYGNKKSDTGEVLNPIELDLGEGITGRCAAEQRPILVHDVSKDPSYVLDDKGRLSELAVPILSGGAVIGVIDSEHSSKNFYNSQHVATLKALSSIITTRYENSRDLRESEAKLRHLANFDSLSKLPNRHNFMDSLATAARRCDEGELTSIAVLILDLDRFKLINDAYGHASGDELIVWVSEKFRDILPESILLARLAGDEFAVLVTDQFSVGQKWLVRCCSQHSIPRYR
jgi:putative methionine-R-sulfoxide reductase with GAF domain